MRSNFVCVLVFFLFAGPLLSQEKDPVDTAKMRPSLIKGMVVDQDKAPVEGANVKLSLTTFKESDQEWGTLLETKVETDRKGEFQVKLSKAPPKGVEMYLNLAIGSKVHFRHDVHFGDDRLWTETVELGSLKIARGVRVTGQLVSPDSGVELECPVVMFSADTSDSFFYHQDNCDDEGRFACVIPAGCKLELSIAAENFAFSKSVHKVEALASNNSEKIAELDLGKLKLKHGVSVVGSAKLRDGSPASGIVVGIVEREIRNGHENIGSVSSAKTDSDGRFRLPPHLGSCRLYVLKACRNRTIINGDTQPLESDGKVPFFTPVDIDLDDKVPELSVELVECESAKISGTVYDAKGDPLVGQNIGIGWGSPGGDIGMEGAIEQDFVKTDDEGRYSFQFGKGRMLYLSLNNVEFSNAGYGFFITKEASFVLGDAFSSSSSRSILELEFKPIDQDIEGLDWQVQRTNSESSLLHRAAKIVDWMMLD